MNKINCALVGVGHDHAHDIYDYITKEESSFNLTSIILLEKDENYYNQWKSDYDKYPQKTLEEILNDSSIEAVFIECEDSLLSKYAAMFAKKGIHVHMDKPGAQDKNEFDNAINLARSNNVAFHLGYMYRYNPSIKEALKLHREGALGQVYYIEAQMNISHPEPKKIWLNNFKGGMMNFLGCHLIDLVCLFLGKPDSVVSYNTRSKEAYGEDIALAVLKYGNYYSTVNSTMVEIDGFSRRHVVLVGEKATIEIAPTELFINGELYSKTKYKTLGDNPLIESGEVNYGPTHRYRDMIEEFALIVRGGITNPYSYDYEIMVHDTLLAACNEVGKEIKL